MNGKFKKLDDIFSAVSFGARFFKFRATDEVGKQRAIAHAKKAAGVPQVAPESKPEPVKEPETKKTVKK